MESFRSFRIHLNEDKSISAGFENMTIDELTDGDVVIKVSHSTINYKDALAATGKGRILRKYPLNGGIDLLAKSQHPTMIATRREIPSLLLDVDCQKCMTAVIQNTRGFQETVSFQCRPD